LDPANSVSWQAFYTVLGYQFSDASLLQQALTHRSASSRNNERLEFLGDSVLNFTITQLLYDNKPDAAEGDLSRTRASLVNRDTLAEIANELGLHEYILLGQGERRSGGRRRESILADAVEAIFGAVLLDGGFESCRELIAKRYEDRLANLPDAESLKDPKTRLQEYMQARSMGLPNYELLSESGKDHEKKFEIACSVSGIDMVTGLGSSRRKAEQDAAVKALAGLNRE